MEIEDVKRPSKKVAKTVNINLKVTPQVSKWLKDNGVSPTLLFDKTVKEMMEKK